MLIGVWHKFYTASPDEIIVEPDEIESFVNEVNQAYPGIGIRLDEITLINTGLILFGEDSHQSAESISFGKRSMLIDHENEHCLKGVATLIGVRATTARGMAEKAIDLILRRLEVTGQKAKKDSLKIRGGNIDSFETFLEEAIAINSSVLSEKYIKSLVHNYGDLYASVLQYIEENSQWIEPVGKTATIKAQIVHAIREEMAMKYEDIVLRRTDLATGEIPDLHTLKSGLKVMSTELGWDQDREEEELYSTLQTLRKSMFKKLK
jgi:glycerol-3-phosphate dehydrogenase